MAVPERTERLSGDARSETATERNGGDARSDAGCGGGDWRRGGCAHPTSGDVRNELRSAGAPFGQSGGGPPYTGYGASRASWHAQAMHGSNGGLPQHRGAPPRLSGGHAPISPRGGPQLSPRGGSQWSPRGNGPRTSPRGFTPVFTPVSPRGAHTSPCSVGSPETAAGSVHGGVPSLNLPSRAHGPALGVSPHSPAPTALAAPASPGSIPALAPLGSVREHGALLPRTLPKAENEPYAAPAPAHKPNPFGGARPRVERVLSGAPAPRQGPAGGRDVGAPDRYHEQARGGEADGAGKPGGGEAQSVEDAAPPTPPKPDPFGGAKPRDEGVVLQAIEARRKQREEREALREQERREAEWERQKREAEREREKREAEWERLKWEAERERERREAARELAAERVRQAQAEGMRAQEMARAARTLLVGAVGVGATEATDGGDGVAGGGDGVGGVTSAGACAPRLGARPSHRGRGGQGRGGRGVCVPIGQPSIARRETRSEARFPTATVAPLVGEVVSKAEDSGVSESMALKSPGCGDVSTPANLNAAALGCPPGGRGGGGAASDLPALCGGGGTHLSSKGKGRVLRMKGAKGGGRGGGQGGGRGRGESGGEGGSTGGGEDGNMGASTVAGVAGTTEEVGSGKSGAQDAGARNGGLDAASPAVKSGVNEAGAAFAGSEARVLGGGAKSLAGHTNAARAAEQFADPARTSTAPCDGSPTEVVTRNAAADSQPPKHGTAHAHVAEKKKPAEVSSRERGGPRGHRCGGGRAARIRGGGPARGREHKHGRGGQGKEELGMGVAASG